MSKTVNDQFPGRRFDVINVGMRAEAFPDYLPFFNMTVAPTLHDGGGPYMEPNETDVVEPDTPLYWGEFFVVNIKRIDKDQDTYEIVVTRGSRVISRITKTHVARINLKQVQSPFHQAGGDSNLLYITTNKFKRPLAIADSTTLIHHRTDASVSLR